MSLLLIFVNLTILFSVAAVILHFSDITSDPKWVRWCGHALVFTIIPIIVIPVVFFLKIPIAPAYIIALVWILIIFIYIRNKSNKHTHEELEMQKNGYWKCSKCREYNPKLNLVCGKCSTEKGTK